MKRPYTTLFCSLCLLLPGALFAMDASSAMLKRAELDVIPLAVQLRKPEYKNLAHGSEAYQDALAAICLEYKTIYQSFETALKTSNKNIVDTAIANVENNYQVSYIVPTEVLRYEQAVHGVHIAILEALQNEIHQP